MTDTHPGTFWLPAAPERRLSGELQIGSRVQLLLDDPIYAVEDLDEVVLAPKPVNEPLLHGALRDGRLVSIMNLAGATLAVPFAQGSEVFRASAALFNDHIHLESDSFRLASFSFDFLQAWTQPPSLISDRNTSSTQRDYTFSLSSVYLETANLPEAQIRLKVNPVGSAGTRSISVAQRCTVEVVYESPLTLDQVVTQWVRSFQDLLTVCLGQACSPTILHVERNNLGEQEPWFQVMTSDLLTSEDDEQEPTESQILNFTAPTLVTRTTCGLPFQELVEGWLRTRSDLRQVVALYCSALYAPFIYSEHKFSSSYQAAEALAKRQFARRELDSEAHEARVSAVTDALKSSVSDELTAWVTRLIRHRNDKPLRDLLQELVDSTGEFGAAIGEAVPEFARLATRVRAKVSHGGSEDPAILQRHYAGEVLTWLVRLKLLTDMGLKKDEIEHRASQHYRFRQVLDRLSSLEG
jgi:hypothetical protein